MKLWYNPKSKDPTYYIQYSYRIGKKSTTKNIVTIGKHSELLKITDDPLAYAKEKVRIANEAAQNSKIDIRMSIDLNQKIEQDENFKITGTGLNIGYFYIQYVYQQLKLADFFKKVSKDRKYTYDCNEINRFMVYSRILFPASKRRTHLSLYKYYETPEIPYQNIIRYLDVLAENYDAYISHLFKYSNKIVTRNTSVCYFDCSNFYFEIEDEDEDYVDPVTHETIHGLRKYGFGKDHKPNPIVQMGLFMDSDGIPLTMAISHGSDSETNMAVPCERKMIAMLDDQNKDFVYCADAGLGSENIRLYNSLGGRTFIVTQSIKKLSAVLQERVFTDDNYRRVSDNKKVTLEFLKTFDKNDPDHFNDYQDRAYKVIAADKMEDLGFYEWVTCKNGKQKKVKAKGKLSQYVIVTFSRKYMEYERYIRQRRVERAKKIIASQNADGYKKGPSDVRHYIKSNTTDKDGKDVKTTYTINEEAIKEEEKYDGFYAIAVNSEVLDKNGNPIHEEIVRALNIVHERYKIESLFRTLKTCFKTRPVYVGKEQHIIGHFMICYTALLVLRLLQKKLRDLNPDMDITEDDIIDSMKEMTVTDFNNCVYATQYRAGTMLSVFEKYTQLGLDNKFYLPKALNTIIRNLK